MSRHAAKCKEKWQNEQKRLVHVPFGKKGAIYVPVAKYGLAFGDFKSEPIDEADQSIPAPMPIDENTMDSIPIKKLTELIRHTNMKTNDR